MSNLVSWGQEGHAPSPRGVGVKRPYLGGDEWVEQETLGGASALLRVVLRVRGVAAVAVVPLVGALVV